MSLAFDNPGYLLLLGVLPLLWWFSYRSLAGLGPVRRIVAIALRTLVLALLVLAIADMQLKRSSERLTVIYLLDDSASVPERRQTAMVDYVNREIVRHRDEARRDEAGVIVFGGEPVIECPPDDENIQITFNSETHFDKEHTNIAAAIRLAQAMFPEDSARRIVLLSDGNENIGDVLQQARGMADGGTGIDVVPIRYPPRSEVAVEKVTIPPDVTRGQPFDLRVVVNHLRPLAAHDVPPAQGRLKVTRKTHDVERILSDEAVSLEPGKRVFTIREEIDQPDFYTYEAEFVPDDVAKDPVKKNKRATAFTHVRGKGQVLLIEDYEHRGEFDFLVDRLRHENLQVTIETAREPVAAEGDKPAAAGREAAGETFASLAELLPYDTVVLANVPCEAFSEEQIKMLVRNTQQMGSGLVVLGGANSFGAGGWTDTPLEAAMPVDFQIKNSKVLPRGALAMLMHASEIPEGNFWQKKIALEALKTLGDQDYCGVLHWDGFDQWLWQPGLQRLEGVRGMMQTRIDRMVPGDMPDFDGAVKLAYRAFKSLTDAAGKHMIIISDGDPGPPTNATLQSMKDLKVTISTVAVGAHGPAGSAALRQIALATGGKYYVVQPNQSAQLLPRIYQKEARSMSRPLVYEQEAGFRPQITFPHEMVKGIGPDLPPITGFVLTTVKDSPLVEVAMASPLPPGDKNNTLLATWTYGLGRTVAFTSDAGKRWTSAWTSWENYDKLFSQIIRWSMRPAGDQGKFSLATDVDNGKVRVVVTALNKNDEFLNFLNMTGSAVGPDMKPVDVKIRQAAPGRYVGEFDAKDAGSYFLMLSPGAGMAPIQSGVNVPYSPEYLDRETNEDLLRSLAALVPRGGLPGMLIDDPKGKGPQAWLETNTFRHDLAPAVSIQEIWQFLALSAATLFFFDVFIRRVTVNFEWVRPALAALRDRVLRRTPVPAPIPTMERLRHRKAEVTQSLEQRRAAMRFEPTPETPVDPSAVADALAGPPEQPSTPSPQAPPARSAEQPEDSYTSRLLKAKKKVWDERKDKDKEN